MLNQFNKVDYAFWDCHFFTVDVKYQVEGKAFIICLNTKCSVTMTDWAYLNKHLLKVSIKKLSLLILIYKVGNKVIKSNEFILTKIYFNDTLNGK